LGDWRAGADIISSLFAECFVRGFTFEGAMRSMEVVEALPFVEPFFQIDVTLVD
jgi:hypothetical protein